MLTKEIDELDINQPTSRCPVTRPLMEEADMTRELQVVFSVPLKGAPATSAVTPEVWAMEVPHDESTSFGVEVEYDAGWAPKPKRTEKPGEGHDDGTEGTDERVVTSHTKMREGCEVTSVEEGHDVERVTARSDEIVAILKQLKDEMSADLTALEKKGLDWKTHHQDLMKTKTKETVEVAKAVEAQEKAEGLPRSARPPPRRDKLQSNRGCCRTEEAARQEVEKKRTEATEVQCCGYYQKHYADDAEELERSSETKAHPHERERYASSGRGRSSWRTVSQQNDQSKQQKRERTNLDQSCHQRDNVTAFGARH